MKLQSYYWGCQSWSYQTLKILGSGGSLTYWIEMVSTKKRGSVTLHVKTLLLTIPSPMNFSLFKENKADQAFGFGADHHQYQGFQGHQWVGLLPGLCQWCPFQNGYDVGAAPLISWCLKGLLSISAFLSPSFSSMDMSLKLNTHLHFYVLWSKLLPLPPLVVEALMNIQAQGLVGWLGLRTNDKVIGAPKSHLPTLNFASIRLLS